MKRMRFTKTDNKKEILTAQFQSVTLESLGRVKIIIVML